MVEGGRGKDVFEGVGVEVGEVEQGIGNQTEKCFDFLAQDVILKLACELDCRAEGSFAIWEKGL